MAASQTESKQAADDVSDVKRKLVWRMGFAGLMIVALLGGLAIFDRLSAPAPSVEPSAPTFTEPVPVARKAITQPVTPAGQAAPESSAAPADKNAPVLEAPPRPEVSAQPVLPRASSPSAKGPAAQPAPSVSAKPAEARVIPMNAAPTSVEPVPAAAQTPPAPPRLFSGYALQAGVFSDPRRAEELHAKLTLEGIPSTIEARVEVGPFKSRAEAEASREKLKALGIDAVLLPPKGVKR